MEEERLRIDHCVLPTGDLAAARARLAALGFTVAPEGRHPFGTANACVYFIDGTFIEPLAIGDPVKYEAAANHGNVFVRRDRAFRFRRGAEGFSAIVLASHNAAADHARFKKEFISAGPMLRFSRVVRDANGKKDRAAFRLAFAADLLSPDIFCFTCERVRSPAIDASSLQKHANGVTGIAAVVASEPVPFDHRAFLAGLLEQQDFVAKDRSIEIKTGNAKVVVLDRASLNNEFAMNAGHARGLRLRAIVFKTGNMEQTERTLRKTGFPIQRVRNRLVVPPAPGQGAAFAFEG